MPSSDIIIFVIANLIIGYNLYTIYQEDYKCVFYICTEVVFSLMLINIVAYLISSVFVCISELVKLNY